MIVFVFVCLSTTVVAQEQNAGYINIDSARLSESGNGWLLSANADIQLTPRIRQGLDSGVPLQFIVDFRIKQPRPLWPDKTVLAIQQRYRLIYYVLTRHYRLQRIDSVPGSSVASRNQESTIDNSQNFRSLLTALNSLGRVDGIQVVKPDGIEHSGALYGELSLRLDDKALPLPLQSLFSSAWKLASEDYAWPIN